MSETRQISMFREFLIDRTGYACGCFAMLCACVVLSMAFYAASVPTPPKSGIQLIKECIDAGLNKFQQNTMRGDDHAVIVKGCTAALGRAE